MTTRHRTAITAYVAGERHLKEGGETAKTLSQIAEEIGTTTTTVRRWLRRDHRQLWMQYWPSANELWEEAQREKGRKRTDDRRDRVLLAALDRSLEELLRGMSC
jgi:predicted transcriptional regulator